MQGRYHLYSYKEQLGIIENYYKSLWAVFPRQFDSRSMTFFSTLGFGAVMNALPLVFDITMKNAGEVSVADIVKTLSAVDYFEFSDWKLYGSGNQAELQAGNDLREELREAHSPNEDEPVLRL